MHALARRLLSSRTALLLPSRAVSSRRSPSAPAPTAASGDDEWNDAWELAWLPDDAPSSGDPTSAGAGNPTAERAPWESECPDSSSPKIAEGDIDADTRAFVAEMDEHWAERRSAGRGRRTAEAAPPRADEEGRKAKPAAEADEYRVRKQRIHAGLWMKEIEKLEEARLGGGQGGADDIDRLLDSCSEIFDSGNIDLRGSEILSSKQFKTKPEGWESTSRNQDGNVWEISQREEDILLQEYERRIAFSKQQIASFIKTHIFSRRRPIDGWKYMIEEIGPNARKRKGSVQRLPSITDPAIQPYKEERPALGSNFSFTEP